MACSQPLYIEHGMEVQDPNMAAFSIIRLLPLLALAFFCLELASIILVGQRAGVIVTLLLIITDIVLGIGVIRSAGANAMSALRAPLRTPGSEAKLASGMALRVLAGVLFLIPGFFSDVLALLAWRRLCRRGWPAGSNPSRLQATCIGNTKDKNLLQGLQRSSRARWSRSRAKCQGLRRDKTNQTTGTRPLRLAADSSS